MGTLIFSATVILVVMGFSNHTLWLAAIAVLFLYVRYGRAQGGAFTAGSPGSAPQGSAPQAAGGSAGRPDTSYRAYRDRRDRQAKWERRYRRERPLESRRQERAK
ncbi:hypothetical protein [Streptomyces sp. NPDC002580]|jgi:hypothetical protein|uniref:hypothetical protein n=1 Tax=Streptomyces sp. NPDC002580 TaxID=3364653 RepID=UPI00368EDD90